MWECTCCGRRWNEEDIRKETYREPYGQTFTDWYCPRCGSDELEEVSDYEEDED